MHKATEMGVNMPVGPVYSSDTFYDESAPLGKLQKLGVLAVEMESLRAVSERRPRGQERAGAADHLG